MSRRRARPATTARLVALVVVVALTATACAGAERLSARAFRKQADTQCAKLAAASEELGLAQSEGATGEEVQGYVRAAAEGLRDLTSGLADLRAPESLEPDADALVAALDDYADGLDEIASRVEPGQGLTEALSAAPKLVTRLNTISERATDLVVALGLDGCQLA